MKTTKNLITLATHDQGANTVGTQVLLLTPSRGLGGGIERYVETVESAFQERGVEYSRLDLEASGSLAHIRLLTATRRFLEGAATPCRLVLAHPSLLPVGAIAARDPRVTGISVICHGTDAWNSRRRVRRYAERRLMRMPAVRVVTASSFTAGAVLNWSPAVVLPPGLSRAWFDELARAGDRRQRPRRAAEQATGEVRLLTAFRLADWRDKGLPELLQAVTSVDDRVIRLTICGSGGAPADLREVLREHPYAVLAEGLSDAELADEFASADLFVLATRTRSGRRPTGEGFGLVLLEAQVAGTPVVAPAFGGVRDAYVDGLTGVAPVDESSTGLADILKCLIADPARLTVMREYAARWAREIFEPSRYAIQVTEHLL